MTQLSFCSLAPEAAAFPVTDLEVSGIQKEKKKKKELKIYFGALLVFKSVLPLLL